MSSVAPPRTHRRRRRPRAGVGGRLDVPQGAALTIGAVLGTGVISLPALAAQAAGPASLLAWAGLVLLSVPLATTFAALGARYPDGGGVSTYARRAFGARAATVVGLVLLLRDPDRRADGGRLRRGLRRRRAGRRPDRPSCSRPAGSSRWSRR